MVHTRIKRTIFTAIALFLSISFLTSGMNYKTLQAEDTQTSPETSFEMTAQDIVDDIVFGWNLGNTLDSHNNFSSSGFHLGSSKVETDWCCPPARKELFDTIAETDINAIRLPVTWFGHMDPETYEVDPAWMDRVEEVVNYVLDNDMYCIINLHHDEIWMTASYENFENRKEIFISLWTQICERFNSYDEKLLFEGFNEVLNTSSDWGNPGQEGNDVVNKWNQLFVDTVRSTGGNNAQRVLVCNTYASACSYDVLVGFKMPEDTVENKIIVEVHNYTPTPFTFDDDETWIENVALLDSTFDRIKTYLMDKGYPTIIGEFGGADRKKERLSYVDYYMTKAHSIGVKCFLWECADPVMFNRFYNEINDRNLLNTAAARAKGEIPVLDTSIKGDSNNDGLLNMADAVMLQKWLLGAGELTAWQNVDLCEDNIIDVFDLCMLKRLLVEPPNLCRKSNINVYERISEDVDYDVDFYDNGASYTIKNGGTEPWNLMHRYRLPLEQGVEYKISFDYSASIDINKKVVVQGDANRIDYFSDTLDFTNQDQHYESQFTMTAPVDNCIYFTFMLGSDGTESEMPYTITMKNIKFTRADNPTILDGKNLCEDLDNWFSYVYEDYGETEMTKTDNGVKTEVTKSGEQGWYVQSIYGGLTLEKGAKYRIEFDYSSTRSGKFNFCVQQNYGDYEQYFLEVLNYTDSKQHFLADFTMTEDDDNVSVVFNGGGMGSVSPFTMTISNLSLIRIS